MREMGAGAGKEKEIVTNAETETETTTKDGDTDAESDQQRAFRAAWEAMLIEGMNGQKEGEGQGQGEAGKKDFQAGIRATMDKLKSSESEFRVRYPSFDCYI